MMRCRWGSAIAIGAALVTTLTLVRTGAAADEGQTWEETDQLPTVQNRKYRLEHEFSGGVGTLPTDPYTKGLTFNGGYAWHVNDTWAVEGRFNWVMNFSSSLRDKLEGNFAVQPSQFDKMQMFGQLGGLFKPLYGKLAFLNDQQVYGELFLSLYGVVGLLEGGGGADEVPRGERLAFGGAPGFGIRGFLSRYFSVRLDFNWMVLAATTGEVHTPLLLSLNLGLTTRSD